MKHTRIEEEKAVVEQMIRLYCRKYEGHDELWETGFHPLLLFGSTDFVRG